MSCKYFKKEDIDLSDINLTSDLPLIMPSMDAGKTYAVINGYILVFYIFIVQARSCTFL